MNIKNRLYYFWLYLRYGRYWIKGEDFPRFKMNYPRQLFKNLDIDPYAMVNKRGKRKWKIEPTDIENVEYGEGAIFHQITGRHTFSEITPEQQEKADKECMEEILRMFSPPKPEPVIFFEEETPLTPELIEKVLEAGKKKGKNENITFTGKGTTIVKKGRDVIFSKDFDDEESEKAVQKEADKIMKDIDND